MSYDSCKKEFIRKLCNISNGRYSPSMVFTDLVACTAFAISNGCQYRQDLEDKYLEIVKKYRPDEFGVFPELMALVCEALEDRYGDFLGECYGEIDGGNAKTGQFFTPYSVSRICADITFNGVKETIAKKGYASVSEPACGSGGMIVAFLDKCRDEKVNFQNDILVVACDIDYRCAYMCYITLSLLGCPAVIYIGDTLSLEYHEVLKTPFYYYKWLKFRNFSKEEKAEAVENKAETIKVEEKEPEKMPEVLQNTKDGQLSLF